MPCRYEISYKWICHECGEVNYGDNYKPCTKCTKCSESFESYVRCDNHFGDEEGCRAYGKDFNDGLCVECQNDPDAYWMIRLREQEKKWGKMFRELNDNFNLRCEKYKLKIKQLGCEFFNDNNKPIDIKLKYICHSCGKHTVIENFDVCSECPECAQSFENYIRCASPECYTYKKEYSDIYCDECLSMKEKSKVLIKSALSKLSKKEIRALGL